MKQTKSKPSRYADPSAVPGQVQPQELIERANRQLFEVNKPGLFAYLEVQGLSKAELATIEGRPATGAYLAILRVIAFALGPKDVFSWDGERFLLLFADAPSAQRILQALGRRIGKLVSVALEVPGQLTPAIGSVEVRLASDIYDLLEKAESARKQAAGSLELLPISYNPEAGAEPKGFARVNPMRHWGRVPASMQLFIQFFISSVLAVGVPFIIYAVCDALGADISGPVYLVVVTLLALTAIMIVIEALLSMKAPPIPAKPAAPHPPATVIIPAYLPNEAETIIDTLKAFLRLDYPNVLQIIVAYNTPRPLPVEQELREVAEAGSEPNRFQIEIVNVAGSTSKAQNVNAVIGKVRGDFVGIYDADHHPRPDSLRRAWRWLSNGWDIVQGRCSIRNGEDSWVSRTVAIEFEQIYAVNHPGRARFHGFGIFGGSNGYWRTAVLHETRMRHSMLTEDIDSSIRAVHAGYRIASDRDLISEELAPTTLKSLLNQRLRWAQGWLQVSVRRITPALFSKQVSVRQKFGLLHLLVWREAFPWYSVQVMPILLYWLYAYGWSYINWAVPLFLATTFFTLVTGPVQLLLTHRFAEKSIRARTVWFFQYLLTSMFFYAPFKDTISRIAHVKEFMGEKAWRVTRREVAARPARPVAVATGLLLALALAMPSAPAHAQNADAPRERSLLDQAGALMGGAVRNINEARRAASEGRHQDAARLFKEVIETVPSRRMELLPEYADALNSSSRSAEALPLYRELLASNTLNDKQKADITAKLALATRRSSDGVDSILALDNALAANPNDANIALQRSQALSAAGRHPDAIDGLDRVAPAAFSDANLAGMRDAITLAAARDAARTDKNELSAKLFERALRQNAALRASVLREYADQLTYSKRSGDAVPLYREVLSKLAPRDAAYDSTQRGLALALEWSSARAEALTAWSNYLKSSPNDVDALVHTAQIQSALGQNEQALQTYRTISAKDSRNAAAKRGIVDETANLARAAMRDGRKSDGLGLMSEATRLDRSRKDLMLEYADLLNTNDQSANAIPVYREVLAGSGLSAGDRARATTGLANAYTWSGRLAEAVEHYDDLSAKFSKDPVVQSTGTLLAARAAAQASRNKEAAELFAQAIKQGNITSGGVLREYADQLSFSGRPADSVTVYRRALNDKSISAQDRLGVRKGLAQAYAWSSRYNEARLIYDELVLEYPDDKSLQFDHQVFRARAAATQDHNAEAAELFGSAIALNPARRGELIREYADQLTFTGKAKDAIPLYQDALKKPGLIDAEFLKINQGLAQAYDWSGQTEQANAVYATLARKYPGDTALQWQMFVTSARAAAQRDRNKESADLFARAIKLSPDRSDSLLREYADQLTYSNRSKDAVPVYLAVLRQPNLKDPEVLSARKGLALAYSWSGQPDLARRVYQELVDKYPNDAGLKWEVLVLQARAAATNDRNKDAAALLEEAMRLMPARRNDILGDYADQLTYSGEGKLAVPLYREMIERGGKAADVRGTRLKLALALTWTRQLDAGLAEYQRLLAIDPTDSEAQVGAARTLSWLGKHPAAKDAYTEVLVRDPGNADAQRGLAQVEDWMGHHRNAQRILGERLQSDPNDVEARKQLIQSLIWMGRPDRAKEELARLNAGQVVTQR